MLFRKQSAPVVSPLKQSLSASDTTSIRQQPYSVLAYYYVTHEIYDKE